ncbi:hypothetical protein AC579_10549 [Pseudocercospora musae]|uniref:Uncharacterized protein n=1 Tax=Pseudocercospora musae TaxID=113226 RepID=A0A139IHM6_9PEZI|nr:hypothetical protein AC579_10549 [Pseudocercospora musae]
MATPQNADALDNVQSSAPHLVNNEPTWTEEQPCRFIDMPREMRDEVDAKLGKDGLIAKKHSIELSINDGPCTSLLLVDRQFGKEHSESVARNITLDSRDGSGSREATITCLTLTGFLTSFTTASFHLIALYTFGGPELCSHDDCEAVTDLRHHIAWVSELQPDLPKLKHSEIWLYNLHCG